MDILDTGTHTIRGIAWTGAGSITSVKVSTDQGHTWGEASMDCHDPKGYAWIPWSIEWNVSVKGEYTIMSKATDSAGRTQPAAPFWNRKGYGYHAIDQVKVKVE